MFLYIHSQLHTLCLCKINNQLAVKEMLGWTIIKTFSVYRGTLNRVSVFVFLACRTPIANHLQLVNSTHVSDTIFKMLGMVLVSCVVMFYCRFDRVEQSKIFIGAVCRASQLTDSASKMFGFGPTVL